MKSIGIDIGTTTICGIVLDGQTGRVLQSKTIPNKTSVSGSRPYERLQDPELIIGAVLKLYDSFTADYQDIVSLGLTGQMHGIVYTGEDGQAVSPLYTWLDERGNQTMEDGQTYAQSLSEKTGYPLATGFGMVTHYWHTLHHSIPSNAVSFCTIQDYAAMRLTSSTVPLIHASDAASLGCYQMDRQGFDTRGLQAAGIDTGLLPSVTADMRVIGVTADQIPVSAAIGDNQASFIGSVQDMEHTILVNVGTGSQISLGTDKITPCSGIELRPCAEGTYLFAGSCLCGGRAYAALEQFFKECAEMITSCPTESLYPHMDRLLREQRPSGKLKVDTRFAGTREAPYLTGSVSHMTLETFHPADFIYGVLDGIAGELFDYYQLICKTKGSPAQKMVGSGNGIRMNGNLQQILRKKFQMELSIPCHQEEASYGAALFSMVSAGYYPSLTNAQQIIKYTDVNF